jgi:hypothetical protein
VPRVFLSPTAPSSADAEKARFDEKQHGAWDFHHRH